MLAAAAREVLRAIVTAPRAWCTPRAIAEASGTPLERTLDLLSDLEAAGSIVTWTEAEGGPVVTLTAIEASRLDVQIEEWEEGVPRWAHHRRCKPPPFRAATSGYRPDCCENIL
jgi:hypothetical protein